MRNYVTKLIAALAIGTSTPASAAEEQLPEWFPVATTKNGTVISARSEDLVQGRSNQMAAKVWVKFNASNDRTISFTEARVLYAINCVARTSLVVMSAYYYRNGKMATTGPQAEQFIVPESNLDLVADLLCSDPAFEPNYR